MKNELLIQDIPTNQSYTLDHVSCRLITFKEETKNPPAGGGRIYMDASGGFRYVRKQQLWYFAVEDENDANYIKDYLTRQYVNLASVIEMQEKKKGYFFLYVVFFPEEKNFFALNVILSEKVQNTLKNRSFNNLDELRNRLVLTDGMTENLYFVYASDNSLADDEEVGQESPRRQNAGAYTRQEKDIDGKLEKVEAVKDDEENEETRAAESAKTSDKALIAFGGNQDKSSFELNSEEGSAGDSNTPMGSGNPYGKLQSTIRLYGKDYYIQVGLYEAMSPSSPEMTEILVVAEKIVFGRSNVPCQRLGVAHEINFVEERQHSADVVRKIFDQTDTYLSIWGRYAELEGEFLLKRMQALSRLKFSQGVNIDEDGFIPVHVISGAKELGYLKKGDSLSSRATAPSYVSNPNISWGEYKNDLVEVNRKKAREIKERRKDGDTDCKVAQQEFVYTVEKVDVAKGMVWLKLINSDELPNELGNLYWDEYAARIQIDRRERAREIIRSGLSANPRLGLIIGAGDKAVYNTERFAKPVYHEHIDTFSANMAKKMEEEEYEPTGTQKHAVDIALNTPDIAIIQGPPGTGKTTVITAILERLNEVLGKNGAQTGEVLITSLQHDAVKNVIERVEINSLPIIKFGSRGEDDLDQDTAISNWCSKLAERIRKKNPQLKATEEQKALDGAYEIYAADPSSETARRFLSTAAELVLGSDLREQIQSLQEKYKPKKDMQGNTALISAIRRLVTTPTAFRDGGSYHAGLLLSEVRDIMSPDDSDTKFVIETLEKASSWDREHPGEDIDMIFRQALRDCRELLLKRTIPRPRYQLEEMDEDIIAVYQQATRETIHPESEVDNILYGLLNQLDYNRMAVKEALKPYMFAFAATAQHSESKHIYKVKGIKNRKKEAPQYDTVIVDEAARVNPGDLMIPLSQAKRRIILVGDHRQLPHMYDQDIFDAMVEKDEKFDTKAIEDSMFQYLLKVVKRLKEQDGVERFITLDAQFRMHPLLGNFVSDNFYTGEEAFSSPLGAERFWQPFYKEPLLWIDVSLQGPRDKDREFGVSRVRMKEVEVILNRIKQMHSQMPPGIPLSIGVISFYRGQVEAIKSRIQRDEELAGHIAVGTVDAYQGKEYDVIFLSIVRAQIYKNEIDWSAVENIITPGMSEEDQQALREKHEKIGRKHYGFLTSEHRLCVALSRQKRLLVVVGNKDLFYGELGGRLSAAYVPALKNFFELCKERGAVEYE